MDITQTKPYTICYTMTSIDGRIDCEMTGQLKGVLEYYNVLQALDIATTVSGRVTAELEIAQKGKFTPTQYEPYGKEGFSKKMDAIGYEVIVDSKGTLLFPDASTMEKPYLIVTTTDVSKEYLAYLDRQHISWITAGKGRTDIVRASEILFEEFHVRRMGVVGGPIINTAFLEAGLLDEVDLLIGLGIDGRSAFPPVFTGRQQDEKPIALHLTGHRVFENGAVWLTYSFQK